MRSITRVVVAAGAIACLTAAFPSAQTTSSSTESKKFEIVAVDGNTLVVRLPEGTRELTVPDDFKFTVNGQPMTVHELKPGMTGTATITTTTTMTPVTVTEVKNGRVAQVTGSSIIVETDQGFRSFSQSEVDKRGVKIMRGGKPAQLSDFRTGDRLTATIVTTMPPKVVSEREVKAILAESAPAATPAPAPRPAETAAPRATAPAPSVSTPTPTPTAPAPPSPAAPAPRKLPKTAGQLPLTALAGLISIGIGATLTVRRRRSAR